MLACGGQVSMPSENSTGPATSATPAATRRTAAALTASRSAVAGVVEAGAGLTGVVVTGGPLGSGPGRGGRHSATPRKLGTGLVTPRRPRRTDRRPPHDGPAGPHPSASGRIRRVGAAAYRRRRAPLPPARPAPRPLAGRTGPRGARHERGAARPLLPPVRRPHRRRRGPARPGLRARHAGGHGGRGRRLPPLPPPRA